jgi:hypothetical protein
MRSDVGGVFAQDGNAKFSLEIDGSRLTSMPSSFTATITSIDGATSEFSPAARLSQ